MGDAAAVEDHRVVRDAERYLGVLLDEDQRKGVFSDQSIEHFKERFNDERGESFERLVHQQQRGIAHQRAADGEHLLLAAGDLVALVGAPLCQAREEVVDALERPAPGTGGDAEIFLDAERREDLAFLRYEADAEPRALVDRQARNRFLGKENFPRVESGMAHDGREQRGLADAVASQHGQRAALPQNEVDVFEHDGLAVAGPHALQLEGISHGAARRGRRRGRAGRGQLPAACLPAALRPAPAP